MSNLDPFNGYQPANDNIDIPLQDHGLPSRVFKEEEYLSSQLDVDSQIEKKRHTERTIHEQNIWNNFQLSASSIAQLYKDKATGGKDEQWFSFQNAAEHATIFYRDSLESYKAYGELSAQCGYSRRNKELIHWLRKRRKNIKREDLVKFLCGKTSPPYKAYLPRPHDRDNKHMQTFREAVCLGGLNNKMSGINFENGHASARAVPPHQQDLSGFLHDQFDQSARSSSPSRKRSASINGSIAMDQSSPKRKR